MRSASSLAKAQPLLDTGSIVPGETLPLGGAVGELLADIESRMAPFAPGLLISGGNDSPSDIVHTVSVASGYVGLILGFVAAGAIAQMIF